MNTKRVIRRVLFIAMTLAACSGLVVLLVAAIGKRNHELCKDYVISIKGAQKNLFINDKDIEKMLNTATNGKIKDEKITDFNLRKVEQQLKANAWVQDADLYFDNKEILHISIREKEPVARIFTSAGKSFYIDSSAEQMPLSEMMSARVPVFTNFPAKKFLSTKDSALLNDIKKTALFVLNDSFWMAQAEQIDITDDRKFELIPTVGNHIVKLGNGDDIGKKLHRLLVFYQQVLSKTSFNKYKFIDVEYDGQVTGTKEKISKIDSLQLKRNVEKLLQEAKKLRDDTTMSSSPVVEKQGMPIEQQSEPKTILREQTNSNPLKTTTTAKPKLTGKKADEKPKAVMPAKN